MLLDLNTLRSHYRDPILALAERHGLTNVRVFGSVARGEATEESDLDLLVEALPECSLFKLVAFENHLSDMLGGRKVDVILDRSIRDRLKPHILNDAKPL